MVTGGNHEASQSQERQRDRRAEQKRASLAENDSVQQLLKYYQMSLTEEMPGPLFGADQHFQLAIYNEQHERTSQLVSPSLDYLSQDLGFVDQAGFEAIKQLELAEVWRNRLLEGALESGKQELQRYLRNLRPLLLEREIYFYCSAPVRLVKTDVETAHFLSAKGKRPLGALPTSVEAAEGYHSTPERIRELASQVAWLIPMLVVYRKVKVTDKLIASFDGWLELLTPQQNERMYTSFVKHAPNLVNEEVTRLLLRKWGRHRKK